MLLFALKTLVSDRGKLLTALVGVIFSLVLVNVQGGLFFGLINKASLLVDHCDADIWIGRRGIENADLPANIPASRINRVRSLPDVVEVQPFIVASGMMTLTNGEFEPIWIIGSDRASLFGSAWSVSQGNLGAIRQPAAITVDEIDDRKLGYPSVGDIVEINGYHARIAAKTRNIQSFITTPVVFTTIQSARRYSRIPDGYCSYFLVQAREGADLYRLSRSIRQRLPNLDVYTAAEFRTMSQDYWMKRTGIGISFGAATLLGLSVGLLMVGQSLYAMALDHLSDYATLKAIGADDMQVGRVVVVQALAIAAIGSAVGLAIVVQIQRLWSSPLAPIEIPPELLSGGVVVVFGICLVSSILPFLRIRGVDPATVLQG